MTKIYGYIKQLSPEYQAEGFIIVDSIKSIDGYSGLCLSYFFKKTNFTSCYIPIIIIKNAKPIS